MQQIADLYDIAHDRLVVAELKAEMLKQAGSRYTYSFQNMSTEITSRSAMKKMVCLPFQQKSRAEQYLNKRDVIACQLIDEISEANIGTQR